jgi:hypothetical protein
MIKVKLFSLQNGTTRKGLYASWLAPALDKMSKEIMNENWLSFVCVYYFYWIFNNQVYVISYDIVIKAVFDSCFYITPPGQQVELCVCRFFISFLKFSNIVTVLLHSYTRVSTNDVIVCIGISQVRNEQSEMTTDVDSSCTTGQNGFIVGCGDI